MFNAILVRGDAIGDVVFYGRGAGKLPTASAVVADIIDCAKHTVRKKLFGWDGPLDNYVEDYLQIRVPLYVRAEIGDFLSTLAEVEELIPGVTILKHKDAPSNELAFVTPPEKEGLMRQKLEKLPLNLLSIIRVTDY